VKTCLLDRDIPAQFPPKSATSTSACVRWSGTSSASAAALPRAPRKPPTIVSALQSMADRVQGKANSVRDEAAKIGSEAAKLGNHALRRLSSEVEHRPLVTLAVAIGVGILVGLASHHRASPQRPPQRRRR
jgi:hypothetical protein